jgi:hypothetical protein
VQAEDHLGLRVVERALLDHERRPAFLARRRAFLGGLEDELHGAGELGLHAGKDLGRTHQHRHVRVVTAGVHDAGLLAGPLRANPGRERQVHLLGDRQRVHVGAQRHDRPRLAAAQQRHHAGMGNPGAYLQAQGAQVPGDHLARAELAVAQFGVRVDVTPPGDHLRFEGGRERVQAGVHRVLGGSRPRQQPQRCKNHKTFQFSLAFRVIAGTGSRVGTALSRLDRIGTADAREHATALSHT